MLHGSKSLFSLLFGPLIMEETFQVSTEKIFLLIKGEGKTLLKLIQDSNVRLNPGAVFPPGQGVKEANLVSENCTRTNGRERSHPQKVTTIPKARKPGFKETLQRTNQQGLPT